MDVENQPFVDYSPEETTAFDTYLSVYPRVYPSEAWVESVVLQHRQVRNISQSVHFPALTMSHCCCWWQSHCCRGRCCHCRRLLNSNKAHNQNIVILFKAQIAFIKAILTGQRRKMWYQKKDSMTYKIVIWSICVYNKADVHRLTVTEKHKQTRTNKSGNHSTKTNTTNKRNNGNKTLRQAQPR